MTLHQHYHEIRMSLLHKMPCIEIHHIGSTAIDGLKSKGDLDINVRVVEKDFWTCVNLVIDMGYYELEDTLQCNTLRHLKPLLAPPFDTAIQVTVLSSEHDTFVLFNEILRQNPHAYAEYSSIKKMFGVMSNEDYRARKAALIEKYLHAVRHIGPLI